MSGEGHVSDGTLFNWFSDGKTELTGNSLEFIYGTSAEVTLGVKSEFMMGTTSSVHIGPKLEAAVSWDYSMHYGSSIDWEANGEAYYRRAYAASVGGSKTQSLSMNTLRVALVALLTLQSGSMLAASLAAAAKKPKSPDEENLDLPEKLGDGLAIATGILSLLTGLAPMLYIGFQKLNFIGQASDPTSALTLHETSGGFFGTRIDSGGIKTAGMVVGESGMELSAANTDLGYKKALKGPAILGFNTNAETVGGSRLNVGSDGGTTIKGHSLTVTLEKGNNNNAAAHTVTAETHDLILSAGDSPAFRLDAERTLIQHNDATYISTKADTVEASVNKTAMMQLTNGQAILAAGGKGLVIKDNGISIGSIEINAQGVNIGNDLQVLGAAPPPVNAPAVAAPDPGDLAQLQAALNMNQQAENAAKQAQDEANKQLMNVANAAQAQAQNLNP